MIIVTGATGQLGSVIVERLLELVSADQVGVSVRDPDRAQNLTAQGVRVRHGDFTEPASLSSAFEGASQVLVVSPNTLGDEGVAQSKTAIDAAYGAGADRVLYTSHQAASPDSFFPPARDHAAVEAYLDQQGRPYTSLRNGYYTSSLMFHIGDAVQTGELVTPADGRVSWTARADLAAAAAAILTGEGTFDGPTPALTATETVAMEQVAAVLSEVSGRPVRRIVVADDEFLARLAQRGMPEPFARRFLGTYEAMRRGEFALTDPTLGALLDREPQSVRSALSVALTRQAVDAWSRASD